MLLTPFVISFCTLVDSSDIVYKAPYFRARLGMKKPRVLNVSNVVVKFGGLG